MNILRRAGDVIVTLGALIGSSGSHEVNQLSGSFPTLMQNKFSRGNHDQCVMVNTADHSIHVLEIGGLLIQNNVYFQGKISRGNIYNSSGANCYEIQESTTNQCTRKSFRRSFWKITCANTRKCSLNLTLTICTLSDLALVEDNHFCGNNKQKQILNQIATNEVK